MKYKFVSILTIASVLTQWGGCFIGEMEPESANSAQETVVADNGAEKEADSLGTDTISASDSIGKVLISSSGHPSPENVPEWTKATSEKSSPEQSLEKCIKANRVEIEKAMEAFGEMEVTLPHYSHLQRVDMCESLIKCCVAHSSNTDGCVVVVPTCKNNGRDQLCCPSSAAIDYRARRSRGTSEDKALRETITAIRHMPQIKPREAMAEVIKSYRLEQQQTMEMLQKLEINGQKVDLPTPPPPSPLDTYSDCNGVLQKCVERVGMEAVDGCVANVPTCKTDAPWKTGELCCPERVVLDYRARRSSGAATDEAYAKAILPQSNFPGLTEFLDKAPQ